MSNDVAAAFASATDAFTGLLDGHVADIEARWAKPSALAGYTLGELVAHVATMASAGAARGATMTVERVRRLLADLSGRLAKDDSQRLVDLRPTLPVVMQLGDFAATRVLELVVHGDDLAATLGVEWEPPADATDVALDVLVSTARAAHGDSAVLRSLARRERSRAEVFPVL